MEVICASVFVLYSTRDYAKHRDRFKFTCYIQLKRRNSLRVEKNINLINLGKKITYGPAINSFFTSRCSKLEMHLSSIRVYTHTFVYNYAHMIADAFYILYYCFFSFFTRFSSKRYSIIFPYAYSYYENAVYNTSSYLTTRKLALVIRTCSNN